jgi:hypothetical protein
VEPGHEGCGDPLPLRPIQPQPGQRREERVAEPRGEGRVQERDPEHPPISRDVLVMADPSPARCGPTAFITAAVIGAIVEPIPWPMVTKTGSIVR